MPRSRGDRLNAAVAAGQVNAHVTEAAYALDLCGRIALLTDTPGTITRLFLSPGTKKVHLLLRREMQALGMTVRIDSAGNVRGFYAGVETAAPVLLMGSHIDTVPDAGAFDGVLGVAISLALVRSLDGMRLPFAIEVIAFSEEEGVRFSLPFIGSRAMTGSLGRNDLETIDQEGVSVRQAIDGFGLDADDLQSALATPGTFAFLEMHIEQGPVLEDLGLPLGVATALVGQSRFELSFKGKANHAGTTPMPLRRDALACAAAWIGKVEAIGRTTPGLVATVGAIRVAPGVANVIAGSAVVSLDVRHASDAIREQVETALLKVAEDEAAARGVSVDMQQRLAQDAVPLDDRLIDLLASCVATPHRMVAGAGHDAMMIAGSIPSAMLFVRTPGGLSHHPDEAVAIEDVQAAFEAMRKLLHSPNLLLQGDKA